MVTQILHSSLGGWFKLEHKIGHMEPLLNSPVNQHLIRLVSWGIRLWRFIPPVEMVMAAVESSI